MPTLTIRHLPADVVERLEHQASRNGTRVETEVRSLLIQRFSSKADVLTRARERWMRLPAPTAAEINRWRRLGRP